MRHPLPLLATLALLAACAAPPAETPQGVACTMDAKVCPDGSAVGRVPPSCEFAPCPGAASSAASAASSPRAAADQSIADGVIRIAYDPADVALAVSADQMPGASAIPPCDPDFRYCFHADRTPYAGSNFESAGLAVTPRPDLPDTQTCLSDPPQGYPGLTPVLHEGNGYATTAFGPLDNAGAGHYAHDAEYRLWTGRECYALRTRVAATQIGNYPQGTVREFTAADEAAMSARLRNLLDGMTFVQGGTIVFPPAPVR